MLNEVEYSMHTCQLWSCWQRRSLLVPLPRCFHALHSNFCFCCIYANTSKLRSHENGVKCQQKRRDRWAQRAARHRAGKNGMQRSKRWQRRRRRGKKNNICRARGIERSRARDELIAWFCFRYKWALRVPMIRSLFLLSSLPDFSLVIPSPVVYSRPLFILSYLRPFLTKELILMHIFHARILRSPWYALCNWNIILDCSSASKSRAQSLMHTQ